MSASLLSLRSQVRGGTSAVGDCLRRQAASRRTLQRQLCVGGGGFSRTDRHARSGADLRRASSRQPPPSPRSRLFSAVASSSASAPGPTLFGDTIIVTKRCAERLNELRETKAQPTLKLRLSVEGGGCSGFQYKFSLEDSNSDAAASAASEEDYDEDSDDEDEDDIDHEFERDGAVLVVDSTSLEFVKGATVDFEEDMMRSAFAVLNNPVSESACGCGSSFALKNFAKNPALD